jgi:hypothetical protein
MGINENPNVNEQREFTVSISMGSVSMDATNCRLKIIKEKIAV